MADSDMQSQLAADPRPDRLGRTSLRTSAQGDSDDMHRYAANQALLAKSA